MEKGNLSINSENILPIIKKWLYSDMDIFLRELVSNGCDAVTKLEKLKEMGEASISDNEKFQVKVVLDSENKLIKIIDNGIGMTADEIKQYINQIAFSGASDFIEKYKEKISDEDSDIIGHFGLGFYSAFMVADTVQIDSLSYQNGAVAAKWVSDGGIEYEMGQSDKINRGTEVTLFISEDAKDFLSPYKLQEILRKYCGFMPVEIYFEELVKPSETVDTGDEEARVEEKEEAAAPTPINDTAPLWLKAPSACTDEEYKDFYHKVFTDFNDPLFWIHLNMDYPFRLKGILYFPKLRHDLETVEGQIKLYCNQVFVADNVKEVVPEFLLLLKGALDCPDIPLNVSRSFLQNDANVAKMSTYITRKVADKLNSLFKADRKEYEGYWDDISPFIKFGCIKDKSFYEKTTACALYKTTTGDYVNLEEYLERNKEKNENKVFYVSNVQQQSQYINMFKEQGLEAILLTNPLDNPYISYLEMYTNDIQFLRIDSDISQALKADGEENKEQDEALTTLFRSTLGDKEMKIEIESLKSENVPAVILLSEQARRMQEMSVMFSGKENTSPFSGEETLILNRNNNLVKTLLAVKDDQNKKEDVDLICRHIYDLAMMSHKPLDTDEMTAFIDRSNKLLEVVINK